MPSYAGFYITPEDWSDWLRTRCPSSPDGGPATAEVFIQKALDEKKLGDFFAVITVPKPLSEPGEPDHALMVYRIRSDEKEYISQRAGSKIDFNGSRVLERVIGLKASEWRTIWFNNALYEWPFEAEFLKPCPLRDENHSNGACTCNGVQRGGKGAYYKKIRIEFKFEDAGAGMSN